MFLVAVEWLLSCELWVSLGIESLVMDATLDLVSPMHIVMSDYAISLGNAPCFAWLSAYFPGIMLPAWAYLFFSTFYAGRCTKPAHLTKHEPSFVILGWLMMANLVVSLHLLIRRLHVWVLISKCWYAQSDYRELWIRYPRSLELRLSEDLVAAKNCETKSAMESLDSRLGSCYQSNCGDLWHRT